jgi:hypothetical protein
MAFMAPPFGCGLMPVFNLHDGIDSPEAPMEPLERLRGVRKRLKDQSSDWRMARGTLDIKKKGENSDSLKFTEQITGY